MAKNQLIDMVVEHKILNKILVVRGEKVMMDRDLAVMYGIETKVFNQAVRRHIDRFQRISCLV
jgi:ORF6N domain